jgi:hypothetical protein
MVCAFATCANAKHIVKIEMNKESRYFLIPCLFF